MSVSAWPIYEQDEIDAVVGVLQSGKVNYWTGDTVTTFEAAYAEHLGVKRALAVANGTLALEVALGAFSIGPGHDVLVPLRAAQAALLRAAWAQGPRHAAPLVESHPRGA